MKLLKYFGFLLVLQLFAISCKLDETIYDDATPDNTIKTESDLDYAMIGAYSHLNSINLFGRNYPWAIHPYADDISSVVTNEPGIFARKTAVTTGTSIINSVYTRFYAIIKDAHAVIGYADKVNLTEAKRAKIKSEACFLRAFAYFNLVQLFGGVPLVTSSTTATSDFYTARASVDQVYGQIFKDLEEGTINLPLYSAQPAAEFYRATRGAAQGYLAKAYLTYANYLDLHERTGESATYYQKAKENADAVISSNQYSLVSDYGALWDVTKEKSNYSEVIFAVPHTRDATNITSTGEGSYFPAYFLVTSYPNSTGTSTHAGLGIFRMQPWFVEHYTKGDYVNDYRFEKSFLTTWIGPNGARRIAYPLPYVSSDVKNVQPYLGKYVDPDGLSDFGHENDHYLLRYSEILLIKAEAENELNGPTTEALDAFNQVRERARKANGVVRTTPADVASGISKLNFRMKIFDERGLEFVGEFHRFFDLIRMRYTDNVRTMYQYQFGVYLPTLKSGLPVASGGGWAGGVTQPLNLPAYNSKFLLWPIPANQIAVNPKLTQNPGW